MTSIVIRGARTNNLADVDVDIARNALVVVVGVSGSGKSSLVFDTIVAEAGFQLNETFPPFARNRLPKWTRPTVDHIAGLSTVIVIDQRRLGGNSRSTVGTITDAWTYLRLVFSRLSEPHVGESNRFSFNDPSGMCPTCQGLGEVLVSAVERFVDLGKSLAGGAISLPGFAEGGYWHTLYTDVGVFPDEIALADWSDDEREALLYGRSRPTALDNRLPKDFEGVVERFERIYLHTADELSDRKQRTITEFTRADVCADCNGERLAADARVATVDGRTIGELARLEISELADFVAAIDAPSVAPALAALSDRLAALDTIGLGYLTLGRQTTTLSGGEGQRVKAVRHLGSSLTEMLYVFDEPTVGLHPTDVESMIRILEQLRDAGNTVIVVEHDPAVMAHADEVVEIGPAAGRHGGQLVFQGSYDELLAADTPTGRAIGAAIPPSTVRQPTGWLTVAGATRNNLRDVTVELPTGVMTVLTGVAGSGKSSLAAVLAEQHDVVVIDQQPVTTNRRSTPITYTGIAAPIRKLFAHASGAPVSLFSANSAGGCSACGGVGIIYTDLAFMDGQELECPTCHGAKFNAEALARRYDGLTIADVERLSVDEAIARLPSPAIVTALQRLADVGLGYLALGQSLSTLSGGECQRLKIAKEIGTAGDRSVYLLDEPTTGLHLDDIATLLGVLDRLVDEGHTMVVIEHHLDVIAHADWLVDLGPGPGRRGGGVLYEGTVSAYVDESTPTGGALSGRREAGRTSNR